MASEYTPADESSLVSTGLGNIKVNVTGHDESGREYFVSSDSAQWKPIHNADMGFAVLYTTSEFPASLNDDVDVAKHKERMESGTLGLVNPNGTLLRMVDFAPGPQSLMHRTRSLDYGIVIHGTVEAILDSGEKRIMKAGDVCIQRGTSHAWRNTSDTEWARIAFVLQDCQAINRQGESLKEDLPPNDDIPPSGNDA